MPRTDAQRKYDAKNISHMTLSLNSKTESDIIKRLESVANRGAYIKRLIREDMERNA